PERRRAGGGGWSRCHFLFNGTKDEQTTISVRMYPYLSTGPPFDYVIAWRYRHHIAHLTPTCQRWDPPRLANQGRFDRLSVVTNIPIAAIVVAPTTGEM